MYDSITSQDMPPLATRIITGNFAIFVNFLSVKYFSLTIVAMIINCAPLVTMFLASPILGEKVTAYDVISLIFAFAAIGLMILGGSPDDEPTLAAYTPTIFAYVVLLMNPLCLAAGNLAMRAMRKLDDNVVSVYMSLSLFLVFFPMCLLSG